MSRFKNVVVAISGGVDSAVSALLLKKRGYNIQGCFMQNWDIKDEKGHCVADDDYNDAKYVCDTLGIKLTHVNFVKQYWNEVFCYMLKEYEAGYTPNPDILCNRNIKFNYFYKYATEVLKADAIATGHYARSSFGSFLEDYRDGESVRLLCAVDERKDQTYFLNQVKQEALRKTMFPVGNLLKRDVKQIAAENGLAKITAKKESMGICFIGSRNFQHFITEYIEENPGNFVNVDTGQIVGKHSGFHQWTLGQRARLHNLVPANKEPFFIARKDTTNNTIYVVEGTAHPLLYTNLVFTLKPHWIHSEPEDLTNGDILKCAFKFQHSQHWIDCEVGKVDKGLVINLAQTKRAITPGQFAVLMKDGECLGGAKIANAGVTHFGLHYLSKEKYVHVRDSEFDEENECQIKVNT